MEKIIVNFATGNAHKVEEVKYALKDYSLDVKALNIKGVEIQAETVEEIAKSSALKASRHNKIPLIVEDTGLFIYALKDFPGAYAAYVYKTIGIDGILRLLKDVTDRKAMFRSAVAFCNPAGDVLCFVGESLGVISFTAKGDQGFGFDPIFEPYDGAGKTLAEMSLERKNLISHRACAVRKFAAWYVKH